MARWAWQNGEAPRALAWQRLLAPVLLALALLWAWPVSAQTSGGGLSLDPAELSLTAEEPAGAIRITNPYSVPLRLRITPRHYRMVDEGRLVALPGPTPPWSAQPLIRWSPRSLTLAPGEQQALRVLATVPPGEDRREWRVHLALTGEPPRAAGPGLFAPDDPSREGLSIKVQPIFTLAVPVFVRRAAPELDVSLQSIRRVGADTQVTVMASGQRTGAVQVQLWSGTRIVTERPVTLYPDNPPLTLTLPSAEGDRVVIHRHGRPLAQQAVP